MDRVVILGPGGAGKSTAARRLSQRTGLPLVELDQRFWRADLTPMSKPDWTRLQAALCAADRWILEGDLGPHDVLAPRLGRADAVILLDYPLWLCAWRAARRSRERAGFWWWLLTWRVVSRPGLLRAIARHAPDAALHVATNPEALERLLTRQQCGGDGVADGAPYPA